MAEAYKYRVGNFIKEVMIVLFNTNEGQMALKAIHSDVYYLDLRALS